MAYAEHVFRESGGSNAVLMLELGRHNRWRQNMKPAEKEVYF